MPLLRFFLFTFLLITCNGINCYAKPGAFSSKTDNELYNSKTDSISSFKNTKELQIVKQEKHERKLVVSLFVILVILLCILIFFVYENNELKRKNKQKDIKQKLQLNIINSGIDGQESERKKIASFLHDNVNSLLSSVGLHLNVFVAQNNIKSVEILKAKTILEEVHDRLRDMSHELIPTLLVRFGLVYALEDLCEKNSNSSIHFEFISNVSTEKRYNEKFEIKIYFIVTELFNNIIKHSGATEASIKINQTNSRLIITIKDNGKGFHTEKLSRGEGFGLNRIRARIKKLKGSFIIISKMIEKTGTSVKIKVPTV
ncbi:histidine kinase [Flavobacterium sp. IR1]|nr:histidine kinase [Flavobacterium sp. IR1]